MVCEFLFSAGENPAKVIEHQSGRNGCGCDVGDRFGNVYAVYAEESWQDKRQRDEQNDLSEDGDKERYLRLTKSDEHTLRRILQAEDAKTQRVDAQSLDGQLNEIMILRKETDEGSRYW